MSTAARSLDDSMSLAWGSIFNIPRKTSIAHPSMQGRGEPAILRKPCTIRDSLAEQEEQQAC